MKTLLTTLCLLGLSACAARTPSPALVAAAAHPTGEAVGNVLSDEGQADAAERIATADITVTFEPVTEAELGVPTRGYGSEWVLMDRTITRGPSTTGEVRVSGEPPGWRTCTTCSDHWIAGQLGGTGPAVKVDPPQEYVSARTVVTTVTEPRSRNPIGSLFRGIVDAAKMVVAPVATLVAASAETLPALQGTHGPDGPYPVTREVAGWLFPDPNDDLVTRRVSEDVPGHWRNLPMPMRPDPSACAAHTCRDTIALRRWQTAGGSLEVVAWPTSQGGGEPDGVLVPFDVDVMGGTASVFPTRPWTPSERDPAVALPAFAPEAAVAAIRTQDADALSAALDGADLDAPVQWNGPPGTLLHAAVASGWTEGVRRLLDAGADPNAVVGRFGRPPLAYGTAPQHILLVQAGARRTVPDLAASVWAAAPLQPDEEAYAARALAADPNLPVPATLEHLVPIARSGGLARARLTRAGDIDDIGLDGLRTALTLDGPAVCGPTVRPRREAPTRRALRAAWGRPTETYREGDTWVAQWPGRLAVAQGRDVVRLTDDCAWEPLIGHTRATVHLALGTPDYEGPQHDLYEATPDDAWHGGGERSRSDGGLRLWPAVGPAGSVWTFRYEDGVLEGVERVYRP